MHVTTSEKIKHFRGAEQKLAHLRRVFKNAIAGPAPHQTQQLETLKLTSTNSGYEASE